MELVEQVVPTLPGFVARFFVAFAHVRLAGSPGQAADSALTVT